MPYFQDPRRQAMARGSMSRAPGQLGMFQQAQQARTRFREMASRPQGLAAALGAPGMARPTMTAQGQPNRPVGIPGQGTPTMMPRPQAPPAQPFARPGPMAPPPGPPAGLSAALMGPEPMPVTNPRSEWADPGSVQDFLTWLLMGGAGMAGGAATGGFGGGFGPGSSSGAAGMGVGVGGGPSYG